MAMVLHDRLADGTLLSVGRADCGTVTAIGGLFAGAGNPKSRELLDWHYLGRPGGAYVALAHTGADPLETAVAAYSAFPVPFRAGGREGSAIQSFDTLTLPSHRGRGLFVRLASMAYDLAAESGELAVFGFPNDQSVHGFSSRLCWQVFGQVPFLARPIGTRYLRRRAGLRRRVPCSGEPVNPADACQLIRSRIPDGESKGRSVGVQPTDEYLRWRLARPGASYRAHVHDGSGGRAVAVVEAAHKHGAALAYLMWVGGSADDSAVRGAVRAAMAGAKHQGLDLCLAWSLPGDPLRPVLRKAGFLPLPDRVRPIELNFGVRVFDSSLTDVLSDVRNWRISYLDSDTV